MSKNDSFQKFITYKSNAAKKEQFKQEKRAAKKERAAAIEKRFEEKRAGKQGGFKREEKDAVPSSKPAAITGKRFLQPSRKEDSAKTNHKPGSSVDKNSGIADNAGKVAEKPAAAAKSARPPKPGSREEKNILAGKPELNQKKSVAADRKQVVPARQQPINNTTAKKPTPPTQPAPAEGMPLNKFVAHSGICSRRDAAELIRQGEVKVNDEVITEPGTKVSPKDNITFKGKKITPSKNLVYILLNKPKDYITTLDDPEGRKTVLDLIKRATDERVYPVGRLDRNTSGVLLITNDGELAQTLSHPSNDIKKIYEVRLDKQLTRADFEKLQTGIQLEDGFIVPDALGYVDSKDKTIIGIEIHSGRNRIVRRMFEHLGYDVRNLDRVTYAGLTKKNVQRGKWRFLTEKEVRILRHFNPQTKKTRVKK